MRATLAQQQAANAKRVIRQEAGKERLIELRASLPSTLLPHSTCHQHVQWYVEERNTDTFSMCQISG